MRPELVTSKGLRQILASSDQPVVVNFSIPWCGPCQQIEPMLDALEQQWSRQVRFCRIDADREPEVGWRHRILIAPTLVIFRGGREVGRLEQPRTQAEVSRALTNVTASRTTA